MAGLIHNTPGSSLSLVGKSPDSRKYFLSHPNGGNVPVCASFFRSTFSMTKSSIADLTRGKNIDPINVPVKKKPPTAKDHDLDLFFEDLPLMPSHYNRENSSKKYLPRDINSVAQLHRQYKRRQVMEGKDPYKLTKFSDEYNIRNITLYIPVNDQCSICVVNHHEP